MILDNSIKQVKISVWIKLSYKLSCIQLVFKNMYIPLAALLKHTSYFGSQSIIRESFLKNGSLHLSTAPKYR